MFFQKNYGFEESSSEKIALVEEKENCVDKGDIGNLEEIYPDLC